MNIDDVFRRVEQLNTIGISLSAEKDQTQLLEKILHGAINITHADAGTLYLINDEKTHLQFEILHNTSMNIHLGGSSNNPITLDPIPLYLSDGCPNTKTVAACAAISGDTINIDDVYESIGFDFSGPKSYDEKTGYRSRSFLTIPMRNHENDIIGVLQLINCIDTKSGEIIAFSPEEEQLAESLTSQAAVAITNRMLLCELQKLLETFIEVIADAIDEKSPYTGGHCRRVPEIANMMAAAIQNADYGPLADVNFSEEELYEIKIAALMHDCGKITTPVHVVDKATKLETIFDRIKLVDARIEIVRRDAELAYLKSRLAALEEGRKDDAEKLEQDYQDFVKQLKLDKEFIHQCNLGGEFMQPEYQARIKQIAETTWTDEDGKEHPLLTEDEVNNLNIPRGTLTNDERDIINGHISTTIRMLQSLPFPKHLKNVPEIAGGHHERMDGKGYPLGLTRDQMSVQARLMGIADIYEALTATDRPYKRPMSVSQALNIMSKMRDDQHIDPDLFEVFVREKVYLQYAEMYVPEAQRDDVDEEALLKRNIKN